MRIPIDPKGALPPSEQIAEQIRFAIAGGRLVAGDRLPSVRGLAAASIVNPNTVAKAYRDLERDGTVETRPGNGVFVAKDASRRCVALRARVIGERVRRAIEDAAHAGVDVAEIERIVARALGRSSLEVET